METDVLLLSAYAGRLVLAEVRLYYIRQHPPTSVTVR